MKKIIITLIFLTLFLNTLSAADYETNDTTIKFTINNKEAYAKMIHNPTSDEFLQLLPLNLKLNDLYSREKYATLPKKLTAQSSKTEDYEIGYVAYYEPTNSFVVYYADDNEAIPGGIIPLAIIEKGIDIFEQNNTNVSIEIGKF